MGQSDQHLEIPTWATGSPGRSDRRMGLHEHPQFANHLLDEPKTFIEGWDKAACGRRPTRDRQSSPSNGAPASTFGDLVPPYWSVYDKKLDSGWHWRLVRQWARLVRAIKTLADKPGDK